MAAVQAEIMAVSAIQILIVTHGLACVLEQNTEVCRSSDGAAGSACGGDRIDCNSGLECLRVQSSFVCAAVGDGSAGSACGDNDDCADSLRCVRVQGSRVCGEATGAAGSACSNSNDCDDSLECVRIQSSLICTAANAGTVGSLCNYYNNNCSSGLQCTVVSSNWNVRQRVTAPRVVCAVMKVIAPAGCGVLWCGVVLYADSPPPGECL